MNANAVKRIMNKESGNELLPGAAGRQFSSLWEHDCRGAGGEGILPYRTGFCRIM